MDLSTLVSLGCYVNAGHVDYYDGKAHTRLGEVTTAGDLVLDAAGEATANRMLADSMMEIMASEAPAIEMGRLEGEGFVAPISAGG